jgi:hypothetical protein
MLMFSIPLPVRGGALRWHILTVFRFYCSTRYSFIEICTFGLQLWFFGAGAGKVSGNGGGAIFLSSNSEFCIFGAFWKGEGGGRKGEEDSFSWVNFAFCIFEEALG